MAKKRVAPKPLTADVGDVEAFASTIKSAWVDCRSDGHDMRKFNVELTEHNTFLRTRKCRRCGALRHQVITRSGHILNTTIEYPEGYLMPKGTGRLDADGRAVFRGATVESEYEQAVRSRS